MSRAILSARQSLGGLTRVELRVDSDTAVSHHWHGQYVELRHNVSGEVTPAQGYFALMSDPGEQRFSVLVKNAGPMAERLLTLPIETPVEVSNAHGQGFPYHVATRRPLLLAATGSGLSAVFSAARARVREGLSQQTFIAYGVRRTQSVALEVLLRDLSAAGVSITICHTDSSGITPAVGLRYAEGRVQNVVAALRWPLAGGVIFVAGHDAFFNDMSRLSPTLAIEPADVYTNL